MFEGEPLVGVVIVHYKGSEDVDACITSLKRSFYKNFFICVVDNSASEGAPYRSRLVDVDRGPFGQAEAALACSQEHVEVITPQTNRGFAAGCNIGIEACRQRGAEYVWLLNPDTTVHADALRALVLFAMEKPEGAAFGSKVLYPPEQGSSLRRIWSAGGRVDFSHEAVSMIGWSDEDRGQFDQPRECDYLPGCALLLCMSAFKEVGPLREDYFMYFEETDWCTRAKQRGYKLYYVPDSTVWHRFDDSKLGRPFMVYYYNRNSLLFFSRFKGETLKKKKQVLFRKVPESLGAYLKSTDPASRSLFRAHLLSGIDFLLNRTGKRFSI